MRKKRPTWVVVAAVGLAALLAGAQSIGAAGIGTWAPAANMAAARTEHTATVLANGKVLVAGGSSRHGGFAVTAPAELFDPASGQWSAAGQLGTARARHTATLLPDGRVLVVGGTTGNQPLASTELYDASRNAWSPGPPLKTARFDHVATLLPNGRVLVAGGSDGQATLASSELFDPAANAWTPAGNLSGPRAEPSVTVLTNGKVLVAGGTNAANPKPANSLNTAELFDPSTNGWAPVPNMSSRRNGHAAVLLKPAGQVLVVGGGDGSGGPPQASAEIFDPATNAWSPAARMTFGRNNPAAVQLPSGEVLVMGGGTGIQHGGPHQSAEVYTPANNTWASAADLAQNVSRLAAVVLPDGRAVAIGGVVSAAAVPNVQLFSLAAPATPAVPAPVASTGRFFPQTGFAIDNDVFFDYFTTRGGVQTFGYPTSRTFQLMGFTTQFFQRRIMQLGPDGAPRLLNLFDQSLFPYANVNGSSFPSADPALQQAAPSPASPDYLPAAIAFVQANAPDDVAAKPVNFFATFNGTVQAADAFPGGGGNVALLPGFNLEMWGVPTSHPKVDPNNANFIYLRFQRGIMMFDGAANATQGVLLADYFKAIIAGKGIPPDLDAQAKGSPFYQQYNNAAPNGLNRPALLPATNLQNAFEPRPGP